MVIQNNLSPEKHIDKKFGNTFNNNKLEAFMMLRNIWMAFHFLDKDMMRNILTSRIRVKPKILSLSEDHQLPHLLYEISRLNIRT